MLNTILDGVKYTMNYTKWMKIIKETYESSSNVFDATYKVKDNIGSEMAIVYVTSLMAYYSKLKHLYEGNIKSSSDIQNEINLLMTKYEEFIYTVSAIKDLDEYKDIVIPEDFLLLTEYIGESSI